MINIFTVFYGEKHFSLFKRALLHSFKSENNRLELRSFGSEYTWHIYTEEKYFKFLDSVGEDLGICMRLYDRANLRDRIDVSHASMHGFISKCVGDKAYFFIAPPDTMYSEGSLSSMRKLLKSSKDGECFAFGHPRVLESFLSSVGPDLSSGNMVRVAFGDHLHDSWGGAEIGSEYQNMWLGGVEWQRLGKSIVVRHLLPTVYFGSFIENDIEYFNLCPSFGHFDHVWPQELFSKDRLVVIGSSDIFFCAEVTDKFSNVPPYKDEFPKRMFWRMADGSNFMMHNKVCNSFYSSFRY